MRLKRKLDIRIMPAIVLACILHYVDRSAVTSARLKGLQSDIRLTDIQYDTVIAIFYASYCPAQIISNMVCHIHSRSRDYLSTACNISDFKLYHKVISHYSHLTSLLTPISGRLYTLALVWVCGGSQPCSLGSVKFL
ncbi:hypothetical protein ID866_10473 [Astraeus odoratus]|nr:hypothetical protein ID866_10473 [Astraeus odoratus]